MSDLTPADAVREVMDGDYPDYAAAAAKKAGLPETVQWAEVRTEYGLKEPDGTIWHVEDTTRERLEREFAESGDVTMAREVFTSAWREVRSDG